MDGWLSLGHTTTQSLSAFSSLSAPLKPLAPSAFHPSSPSFLALIHLLLQEPTNCRMAAVMRALAVASPVSARAQPRRCPTGSSGGPSQTLQSSFGGVSLQCRRTKPTIHRRECLSRPSMQVVMMAKPAIQFIQGTDEQTIPDVRLTKSRDGTNGVAIFAFDQPSVFDSSAELGDITGFYMIDDEGVLQSVDVSAKFVNGKPARIEAKYVMRTPREWDRFMRFMERYSQANGLQFVKK
uniref:Photosystem II reaction center Psb28 protein n=1 Tax=Leersia perrieri TaxID=77586 RepID=A0A0D9VA22_9ORYZ